MGGRHCLALIGALSLLALSSCGEEETTLGGAAETSPTGPSETVEDTAAQPGDDAGQAPSGAEGGGAGACEYQAPPGRLGNDAVSIDLVQTDCEQGQRLAKAGALGQPAGANLLVRRDGFRCEPSTETRGANVVYTCTKGAQEVRFEVEWTSTP